MPIAEVHAVLTAPGSPFELDEAVVRGVPLRVWKAAPPSLRAVLESSRQRGEELFLVYEDERVSYARHFAEVATLARRLVEDLGVQKGDRVAIAMRNFPEWSVAFWAATAAGAVAVPLNAWWTAGELEYGLHDSGSRVLFCDAERHDRLADRLGSLGLDAIVVARPAGPLAGGARPFDDVLGEVDPAAELPDVALDPDDDATIFYTSGTTGFPKGALGTHRNICTNLMSL
ncbi:MAG: fatty acid--CoA ligase, partial [Acidimicrobiales bacterium]|nr:fatty acid--CoA ligase [Acidimicrobiales bacterium]